jgi:hypothetical protein
MTVGKHITTLIEEGDVGGEKGVHIWILRETIQNGKVWKWKAEGENWGRRARSTFFPSWVFSFALIFGNCSCLIFVELLLLNFWEDQEQQTAVKAR